MFAQPVEGCQGSRCIFELILACKGDFESCVCMCGCPNSEVLLLCAPLLKLIAVTEWGQRSIGNFCLRWITLGRANAYQGSLLLLTGCGNDAQGFGSLG